MDNESVSSQNSADILVEDILKQMEEVEDEVILFGSTTTTENSYAEKAHITADATVKSLASSYKHQSKSSQASQVSHPSANVRSSSTIHDLESDALQKSLASSYKCPPKSSPPSQVLTISNVVRKTSTVRDLESDALQKCLASSYDQPTHSSPPLQVSYVKSDPVSNDSSSFVTQENNDKYQNLRTEPNLSTQNEIDPEISAIAVVAEGGHQTNISTAPNFGVESTINKGTVIPLASNVKEKSFCCQFKCLNKTISLSTCRVVEILAVLAVLVALLAVLLVQKNNNANLSPTPASIPNLPPTAQSQNEKPTRPENQDESNPTDGAGELNMPTDSLEPIEQSRSTFGSFEYFVNLELHTWEQHRSIALGQNADLASIHSQDENNVVVQRLTNQIDKYYLGGFLSSSNSLWEWSDGTRWNYTNWGPGQPNNKDGEDKLTLKHKDKPKQWADNVGTNEMKAIYKRSLNP